MFNSINNFICWAHRKAEAYRSRGFALVCMFTCLSFGCSDDKATNDLEKEELRGRVSKFTERLYEVKDSFGEIEVVEMTQFSSFSSDNFDKSFNKRGNITEINKYDPRRKTSTKIVFQYDGEGNKIEETLYDSKNKALKKDIYIFDDRGNKVEDVFQYSGEEPFTMMKYEYDDLDRKVEEVSFMDNEVSGRSTFQYDRYGNLTKMIHFRPDGSIYFTGIYKFEPGS